MAKRGAGMAVSGIKPVPAFHSGLGRPWCIESERGSGGPASASPANDSQWPAQSHRGRRTVQRSNRCHLCADATGGPL